MVHQLPEYPCAICRKRESTQLCDFVIEYFGSSIGGGTRSCDLPMCGECSRSMGPHDFCPEHHKMLPDLELKDPVMLRRKFEHDIKMLQKHLGTD